LLQSIHEDGDGQQRQRGGIEDEEQDLGIRGRVGSRIERLQLAHRAQADRCGGIVEAERVGREVERDEADCRMATRHVRHQSGEQRPKQPCQRIHQSRLLGDLKEAQPQREGAEQQHHDLDGQPRHLEQRSHRGGEDAGVPGSQPSG
jgi:hypothetical protein